MENWPNHQQVLSRFSQWLDETRDEVAAIDGDVAPAEESASPPVGLYQLVEQLTALRHEMKLLTKASRGAEERNEATLVSMQAAIEQFRAVEVKEAEAADRSARPLVEAIIELDESLSRCRGVIETARNRALEETSSEMNELRQRLDELFATQSWWRRLLCRPWHDATKDLYSARAIETQRSIFDALLEGYSLIEKRLHRAMAEQSILRMDCVGKQADPHSMTVLETVSNASRPAGMVVEEVRTGYYWRGNVFRFAEVKAVGKI